jgi:hypothetical protein
MLLSIIKKAPDFLRLVVGAEGFEPPTLPLLSGIPRTRNEQLDSLFTFPSLHFELAFVCEFFIEEAFRIN